MWRSLLVFLALLFIACLEFQYHPGHRYLGPHTQLWVPMLEHLRTPAYLTRDLVSTHPQFAYTIYDESTLFLLRSGKLTLEQSLSGQLFICRLAALLGIYLLVRACTGNRLVAVVLASLINLGALLPGVNAWLFDPESTPRALAFGICLLSFGLLSRAHPVPAGFAGGVALLFDPVMSLPFWVTVAVLALFDRNARRVLRPLAPILLVFVLILANLAQLQPGTPDSQALWERIPDGIVHILQTRSPELWISCWRSPAIYLYLALPVLTVWAVTWLMPALPRIVRWLLLLVPVLVIAAFPLSYLLLDRFGWAAILRWRPLEWCAYGFVFALIALGTATFKAYTAGGWRTGTAWLAGYLCLLVLTGNSKPVDPQQPGERSLAEWASNRTWGSSMFVFPDAGRASYPGVFRAASLRAVWVDWNSGQAIDNTVALAPLWWQRWHQTMTGKLTGDHLQQMLALPIDYYVFRAPTRVETSFEGKTQAVPSVYANSDFRVFEASTLRLIPGRLAIDDGTNRNGVPVPQLPK